MAKGDRVAEHTIGTRIKALRRERGLSQDALADLFGFKDRQTVSAIENGVRRVTASELLLAVEKLDVSLDYFTDPFRLDGEALFSWRQTGVGQLELTDYERTAGQWVGAYRTLAAQVGRRTPLMRHALGLTKQSSFEDAMHAGERFVEEFELGSVPAQALSAVMQDRLGILVLLVDAHKGISGAACRLPEFDAVLIARGEVEGRRNFDLAHELFHILTWEAMPPKHVEDIIDFGGNRVEQLANNFAATVLMPRATLEPFGEWSQLTADRLVTRLNAKADELGVTSSALRWRLVALKELTAVEARAIPEAALRNNGHEDRSEPPALFSQPFAEVVAMAIDQGYLSVRRAARLIGLPIEDLEELFAIHGIDATLDL
ncbi:MAG: XRE family transcriptional regulator [Gammaproteobacteria bacterium]|nr:XRE family transcriptional regulator [Gammaproteobacteria bacterium]